jgi:2-haloacid dehalogenase
MAIKVLIFDIGGTVFDWNTAIVEALQRAVPGRIDGAKSEVFALACRAGFLSLIGAVVRGDRPWLTADEVLSTVIDQECARLGWHNVPGDAKRELAQAWRHMPSWPGAREAIAALRKKYVVAPLTILSWSMAIGSSRRNGIDWDSVFSCDSLGIYKPDPRCYARAAEIVDCEPGEIMMVASHPSDLRAAIAAGYRSCYVVPRLEDPGDDYSDTGFASEFDFVAKNFAELVQLLV